MIPKINRGGRMGGLVRYLVGPGERNEHVEPRLVAGDDRVVRAWEGYDLSPRYNPAAAAELAAHLDAPRQRTGARVTVGRRDGEGNVLVDERGEQVRADAHVWHCSLSLHPSEPSLSDEQWKQLAEEFIDQMGFGAHRWLAIRHGRSAGSDEYPAGNDHVHLVVQLVGEDGKAANVHNDRPRAQKVCGELEREHGLRVVEGRTAKRGVRATDHRQAERAEREHRKGLIDSPVPDRDQLEAAVRVAAGAAVSEAEFIRLLRADGVLVRPRFAAQRADEVVGYSVAIEPREGKAPVWHPGGKVAKDLTLPRLRSDGGWTGNQPDAIEEWQLAFKGLASARPPAPVSEPRVAEAIAELRAVRENAGGDYAALARAGAATFYGWARLDPEHADALERCAIELTRSAQNRAAASHPARYRAPALPLMAAAILNPSNKTLWRLALLQEMIALAQADAAAHRTGGELQRAERLLAEVSGRLEPLRTGFEDAHAAVDPEYAHTLKSHRAGREAQRLNQIATGGTPPRPARSTTPPAAQPRPPARLPPAQQPRRRR